MASLTSLTFADYFVFVLMLGVSSGIGIYYRVTGGRQKTTQEYLMADRNMSIIPVAFSLMASFMSAITILGVSSENYAYGTQFFVINIAYVVATPIAAYLYLPVFFRLQCTSAYEYLERRFGLTTRLTASIAFSIQMILYMGIVLYAPALALSAVTGLSKIGAILSVGLVCTFYSTIGGMKAVLVTDLFQSLLMFAAVFAIIIKASIDIGGLGEIWRIADEGQRIEFFNFDPDPTTRHTVWTMVIGGMFTYLTIYAVNQAQVQRLLTVRNLKSSQLALWINWPIVMCLSVSTSFAGLAMYSRYYKCDPILEGRITSKDQLLPLYVVDSMGHIPGLSGLFIAGIFSGSLSTVSSAVNSLATVTVEDYIKPLLMCVIRRELTDHSTTVVSKILALWYGFMCLAIAFIAEHFGGILQASLSIFGVVGGPLLGTFTLGMFCTWANQKGAMSGLVTGLVISLWIGFGSPRPTPQQLPQSIEGCEAFNTTSTNKTASFSSQPQEPYYFPLYRISYMWYAVIGFFVTVIVGMIVSLIRCSKKEEHVDDLLDPNLFSPVLRQYVAAKNAEKRNILSALSDSQADDELGNVVRNGKSSSHEEKRSINGNTSHHDITAL